VGTPLHRLGRGRGLRWAATLVLAVVAGSLAAATVQRAEQARHDLGDTRQVPVAAIDLGVGEVLTTADVTWTDRAVATVPEGAAEAPVGRVATEAIARGEVVLERRLSAGSADGTAALVAPGRRALAVPLESTPPGLAVGDRVEAFAPSTSGGSLAELARSQGSGARRVARDALVVAIDERSVTVSVTGADAPGLAAALLDGALALALVSPG